MLFTLYYMYATFLQWWRLGTLRNKLRGTLNSSNALLVCDESVIFDTRRTRSIENLLFRRENRIGVTIVPKQRINLSSQWLYFPRDSRYFPIFFKQNRLPVRTPNIYVLVQALLETYRKHQAEVLQLESFGELVAWKVTAEHFEAVLKTDIEKLSKLAYCFSQRSCDINHELQLLRIETIDVDGIAKRVVYDRQYSTETVQKYSLAPVHWQRFVLEVKNVYSKIRDATNPKITIDNGTSKPEDVKIVPVSEVKPIKKDKRGIEERHTLEVNCSDYRRHRSRKHRAKDEAEHEAAEPEPEDSQAAAAAAAEPVADKKSTGHKHKADKHKRKEPQPSTSGSQPTKKPARTSSKDKKLVRGTATCDEPPPQPAQNQPEPEDLLSPTGDRPCMRNVKPPNILVYADSAVARENVKEVLSTIVNADKYVIYDLPAGGPWRDSTALVVVCGNVDPKLTSTLMKYLIGGGQLLCLCSDLLYSVLHTFTTAEVREHELVKFSYGRWTSVKMMHHIFCYQASPAKKQFSKDSDASNHSSGNGSSPVAPRTPSTVEIQQGGKDYTIQVQVLGAEETWQTPSLLLATVRGSEGRAVFSQVHLEIDPGEYVDDESKFAALKDSNQARLDILRDLLSGQLDLDCARPPRPTAAHTVGYFLGRHDLKLSMLNESHCIKDREMRAADVRVLFCGKDDRHDEPGPKFLPVSIHACPLNFNTVSYFETLDTKYIGRLVIYSDVLTSTHALLQYNQLTHGVAVICRQQLGGLGRAKNKWLSPPGSALFSLQLHIANITNLGRCPGLIQHLIMVAVVKAVKRLTGNNKDIKVGIKWPNDLYLDGCVKIGGAMVTSTVLGEMSSVNIGCGVNLSNSDPTTSINDAIRALNARTGGDVAEITHEKFFAQVFNETEKLINRFQIGDVDYFYDYYYEYWLHNDAPVTITAKDGKLHRATVAGIDDHGYLKVRTSKGVESVQPDGNSFDMMKGLIYPKVL